MSWKRTFFLFFIFGSLACFYYFKVARFAPLPKPDAWSTDPVSRQKPILALDSGEEVTRLSFDLSNPERLPERVTLEQTGEKEWNITSPVQAPAEAIVADGLLSVLRLMTRARELPFNGLSNEDYGFDRPKQKICVETGRKERCLLIGLEGATLKGVYGKWEHEPHFFLASSELVRAFDRTLYSLRQKQVLSFGSREVRSVQIRISKQEILMLREGKNWVLKKPDFSIVGTSTVQELFSKLSHLYAKDFVDRADQKDPKLGLTSSSCVIRVSFADGSEQTLIRGSEAPGLDAYYVQNREYGTVFLVSLGKFSELERVFEAIHPF